MKRDTKSSVRMSGRPCPECGPPWFMIAVDHPDYPGRQFWRCDNEQCYNRGLVLGGEPKRYELTDVGRAELADKIPFDVAASRGRCSPVSEDNKDSRLLTLAEAHHVLTHTARTAEMHQLRIRAQRVIVLAHAAKLNDV